MSQAQSVSVVSDLSSDSPGSRRSPEE